MIWCWANAFDNDLALNHQHIEYNCYIILFYLQPRCALVVMLVIISQLARGVDPVC